MNRRLFSHALLLATILVVGSNARAVPRFLTLPFNDPDVKLQQGWIYTIGDQTSCGHQGIDYIKGTVDNNKTWVTFEVKPAAAGEAVLRTSPSYGDYVTVKTVIDGTVYYTLYAHLDDTQRKLQPGVPKSVTLADTIGMAGKTGTGSSGVLHLHFELSRIHFGRPATNQEATDCQNVNNCASCRLDPYGVYGQRSHYPPYDQHACANSDYYWIDCPPGVSSTECNNGFASGFPSSGVPPVHPNGTIIKSALKADAYVLQDGR